MYIYIQGDPTTFRSSYYQTLRTRDPNQEEIPHKAEISRF